MTDPQQPVFPTDYNAPGVPGLTKREYFACAAMQGLLAADSEYDQGAAEIATWAVKQSDALIAELNKTK